MDEAIVPGLRDIASNLAYALNAARFILLPTDSFETSYQQV
jgi:hypothetical protein